MFELSGVAEEIAREAMDLLYKLPMKCKIVSRAEQEMAGDGSEN